MTMTNIKNLNIKNLSDSDIQCSDNTIFLGGTLTAKWGYVFKVTDVSSASKEAYITLLKEGNEIETRLMKIGDIFLISNPLDSEEKQSIKLTNVFQGQEASACFFRYCSWTQQYSNIIPITFPSEVEDGKTYTLYGKLAKDRISEILETPISNEKIYITENGTNISEIITKSDGTFELPFTYNYGFNYKIIYDGTIDVYGFERILTLYTVPGATNIIQFIYPTNIPSSIVTIIKSMSLPTMIADITNLINEKVQNTGWDILDIKMSNNQISLYVKNIGSIDILDFAIVFLLVFRIYISVAGVKILGPHAGAILAGSALIFITLVAIKIYNIATGLWSDTFSTEPTNEDVNNDTDEFYDKQLKKCKDTFDNSEKTSTDCKTYAECMRDTLYIIDYTKGYIFNKASTNLSKIGEDSRNTINNTCIKTYDESEKNQTACDILIDCVTQEINKAKDSANSSIYSSYSKTDTYIPPWEEGNGNGGNIINTLLLASGLLTIGYIGYKSFTSKNKDSNK